MDDLATGGGFSLAASDIGCRPSVTASRLPKECTVRGFTCLAWGPIVHVDGAVNYACRLRLSDQPGPRLCDFRSARCGQDDPAALAVGLIRPEEGAVRAFGTDSKDVDRTALLDAVSVVTHQLLIADNVRYGAKRNLSNDQLDSLFGQHGLKPARPGIRR